MGFRLHDGIVGASILVGVVVGMTIHPAGYWLAGVVAIAHTIQSASTGFCPMHFLLSKVMPAANSVLSDGSRIRLSAVLSVLARRRLDGISADVSRLDNAATAEMADAQTKSGGVRQDIAIAE